MTEKYTVGVDLGATNVRVGISDEGNHILKKVIEKTERQHGAEGISTQIIRLIRYLTKDCRSKIQHIGVGSIGPLNLEEGTILYTPNLPFNAIPLVEPLRNEFHIPVSLLNDCNAAVIGEKEFGVGRGIDNLVYITLSTGIGGGVYVDGHLLLGKDGNASEIGHMVIDFTGQLRCGCGKKGHWEAYCSAKNIPNYVKVFLQKKRRENHPMMKRTGNNFSNITAKILYDAASNNDDLALEIVNSIGELNAMGFSNVINAYDPSVIAIGGALSLQHEELIIKPIRKYVGDYAINRVPEIMITPLREDAVLLGAIVAASKHICSSDRDD